MVKWKSWSFVYSTDICDGTEPTLALVHQEKRLQLFTNACNVGKSRKQDDTEFLWQNILNDTFEMLRNCCDVREAVRGGGHMRTHWLTRSTHAFAGHAFAGQMDSEELCY